MKRNILVAKAPGYAVSSIAQSIDAVEGDAAVAKLRRDLARRYQARKRWRVIGATLLLSGAASLLWQLMEYQ